MKIALHQLRQRLNRQIDPLYLVSGDEQLLCLEAVSAITTALQEQGFREKKQFVLENENDLDAFLNNAATGSLFASKRLICLQLLSGKVAQKMAKKLHALVSARDDSRIVLISAPKLEKAAMATSWIRKLEKDGIWVQVRTPAGNEFVSWVHDRLQSNGCSMDDDALSVFVEMNRGNLLAAHQHIQHLVALYQDQQITAQQVLHSSSDNSQFDIFQLIDCAFQGQAETVIRIFLRISQQGFIPSVLLWHIQHQLRQLLALSEVRDSQKNIRVAMNTMRIWSQRQVIYTAVLTRLSSKAIANALRICAKIDVLIKGGKQTVGIEEALATLLLFLAGIKTPALYALVHTENEIQSA